MAAKSGEAVPGYNYVAQDQIWKDHVHHEIDAAKGWPDNWDFLKTKYEDLVKDDFPHRDPSKKKKILPPTPMRIPPPTPLEERVTVHKSNDPVPGTTAKMIGWRSGDPTFKLEKYGKYTKPRGALIKQLNWPAEAI